MQIALKAYGGISSAFRQIVTPTGAPTPWATVDPTAIKASYITELNQLGFGGDSAGTDYQFGQGVLNAWVLVSGVILASVQLIEDSAFDVDSFVSDRIGESIGRRLAVEAVSGTGSTACLGVITAIGAKGAWGGIGTSGGYIQLGAGTDVPVFGNYSSPTTTELAGNILAPQTLVKMIQAVDPAYYRNAKWFMSPQQAWNLRTVTDANGRPIINFENGFTADPVAQADYTTSVPVAQLFGFPVIVDAAIPALTASTVGGPVFGDLSKAMVMRTVRNDAKVVTDTNPLPAPNVMRLTERYADYLQVGYLGYLRVDMRSNDMRAVVSVKANTT